VDIGVLEEDYSSEWAPLVPTFAIPKKNGTIRVVTDFRKNRTQLIVKMYSITHFRFQRLDIMDMIRSMEGLTFASELD
jgi:hypothetical protein